MVSRLSPKILDLMEDRLTARRFFSFYLRNERMITTRAAKFIINDKDSKVVIAHHPLLLGSRKTENKNRAAQSQLPGFKRRVRL